MDVDTNEQHLTDGHHDKGSGVATADVAQSHHEKGKAIETRETEVAPGTENEDTGATDPSQNPQRPKDAVDEGRQQSQKQMRKTPH